MWARWMGCRPATVRELPATREMLDGVRTELIERIASVESKLSGEISRVETSLTGEIARVESKLTNEIARVENKLTGEVARVDSKLTSGMSLLSGQIHDVRADVARLGVLIEEQNARNSIVFEAMHAMIDGQDRFETRLDGFETAFRSFASPRKRG